MKYQNPVLSGFYPDPSICTDGEKYYLVNSTFQYFPGVPVFESEDLINWKLIGHCLTRESQLPLANAEKSQGIYAPTIRCHAGVFYMITTNVSGGGNFLVHTTDPAGEWSEPVWLPQLQGIDPSLLFADDKCYFTGNGTDEFGQSGIFLSEIDPMTGQQFTEPVCIWHGNGGRYLEGPHLYKINNYYYLMAAEGGTEYGHMEIYARSESPYGPYESYAGNPFLTNRNLGGYEVQGVGHADMVQDRNGNYWLVHLAYRQTDRWMMNHTTGRETYLVPVTFDKDGWFTAGINGTTRLEIETDRIDDTVSQNLTTSYTFANTSIGREWMFLRTDKVPFYEAGYDGDDRCITFTGTDASINDVLGTPAFLGIRQKEMYGSVIVNMLLDKGMAGISLYMDEEHHYDLVLQKAGIKTYAVLKARIGDIKHDQMVVCIDSCQRASLKINLSPLYYGFEILADGKHYDMGKLQSRYLSTEVASGFTGVVMALFAEPGSKASFSAFNANMRRFE